MNGKIRWTNVIKDKEIGSNGPFFVPYKKTLIPLRKIQQVRKK